MATASSHLWTQLRNRCNGGNEFYYSSDPPSYYVPGTKLDRSIETGRIGSRNEISRRDIVEGKARMLRVFQCFSSFENVARLGFIGNNSWRLVNLSLSLSFWAEIWTYQFSDISGWISGVQRVTKVSLSKEIQVRFEQNGSRQINPRVFIIFFLFCDLKFYIIPSISIVRRYIYFKK